MLQLRSSYHPEPQQQHRRRRPPCAIRFFRLVGHRRWPARRRREPRRRLDRPVDPEPRDHILTDAELVKVWRACGDDDFGRIVRLLILLVRRREEIGGMQWDELDLDGGMWRLPRARSKNGREHAIALPQEALAILSSTPRGDGIACLVFAPPALLRWPTKEVLDRQLAGTVRPWRLHDIAGLSPRAWPIWASSRTLSKRA